MLGFQIYETLQLIAKNWTQEFHNRVQVQGMKNKMNGIIFPTNLGTPYSRACVSNLELESKVHNWVLWMPSILDSYPNVKPP